MNKRQGTKNDEQRTYSLNQIYFYLTEGCNLKCRHCWLAPKYQTPDNPFPSLDRDLFRSIIRQAKPLGLSGVKLTGGEPLIHPDILDLLEVVRSEKLHLTLETNGVACTPELAEAMKATCDNPFVSVSIDGADAETHEWVRRVEGCFDAALDGVRNLVNAGFEPQIIMSVMRRNMDQIEPVVRLAETLGAGSVKFNLVQPTARGEKMHEALETLTIEELVELGEWVENTLSKINRPGAHLQSPHGLPSPREDVRRQWRRVRCLRNTRHNRRHCRRLVCHVRYRRDRPRADIRARGHGQT